MHYIVNCIYASLIEVVSYIHLLSVNVPLNILALQRSVYVLYVCMCTIMYLYTLINGMILYRKVDVFSIGRFQQIIKYISCAFIVVCLYEHELALPYACVHICVPLCVHLCERLERRD